ncbi:DinB family protein [Streptomyces sp. NPDC021093]|uniref:DinB family protein n=1 Tax=Streptomyces sp. NPDC021093 TaxID=3365112 RepID=UPI00378C9CBD
MTKTPDGRTMPPLHTDERTMLEAWLDFHRDTLALKCEGLDDTQARLASVPPSAMTMLGLVRHLARVERNWFQGVFADLGVPVEEVTGQDAGFAIEDVPEGDAKSGALAAALSEWREAVALGRSLIADAALEDSGTFSREDAEAVGSDTVSLRWILVHMIEEYARHNGHADLIREVIDGTTGP